ncbi:MAG: hypothetical protein A3K22_00975 [Deltaproteobacteria bacterium RBG_16_42_7]|nr:MAG: hypothetical protein A3K22_00975 [Deltaproteobacteria bacterium RBG_16_42_7]
MAQAIGAKGLLAIQEETTYKTDPATPDTKKIYFVSESLKSSRNLIDSNTIVGSREASKPTLGNKDVSGSISLELQAYMALLLKASFGSLATTGAGPYIHTLKIGASLPSLLIEKGFSDIAQYFKYNGCKINKFGLSIKPEGFQDVSIDIIGAKETVGGATFDSTPTDLGKQSFNGFVIGTIEEGGSAIANVVSVDGLSLENNLDGSVYVIGGAGERKSLPEDRVKVSGTLKALFENLTLYNKAVNSTESSLKVKYLFGDGLGSAGNESLEFLIPELIYSPNAPVISGPTGIYVDLPFTAYYENSAEATTMQAILKNTQATV